MYLRARLEKSQPVVREKTRAWRAERLRGNGSREAAKLLAALEERGWRLLALGDYLFCPYEPCSRRIKRRPEDVLKLAFDIDAHLHQTAALRHPAQRDVEERTSLPLLEERLKQYYDLLAESPELATVIEFRRAIRAEQSRKDLVRASLRNRILEWARGKPFGAEFVLEGLLALYGVVSDSAGLIEACRRLAMLDMELSVNGHLELGEAFYWYAFEIDPNCESRLSDLALSQAASHFFEAEAAGHLEVLNAVKQRG
jgi:hypothetical protein